MNSNKPLPIKEQENTSPASKAEEDNERTNILDRGMSCKDLFEPDTTCGDIKE